MAGPQDPKLAALLELERRGALDADTAPMLAAYRAQGTTKTRPLATTPRAAGAADPSMQAETAKSRDDARALLGRIGQVEQQLGRVRQLYGRTLKGTGVFKSLGEYLPSQANAQFDSAAAELGKLVRPTQRTPGEGAMSDFESKLALQALPNRWNLDGANDEAIGGLDRFLRTARANAEGLSGQAPRKRLPGATGRTITIDLNGN